MARSLLDMPSDLLLHVLAFLPVQALLRFSTTCKYSHLLATSSLHTLSLAIYSDRTSAYISKVESTDQPRPKQAAKVFDMFDQASSSAKIVDTSEDTDDEDDEFDFRESLLNENKDPHKISVIIKEGRDLDYSTLLMFHTKLSTAILNRHGTVLRNLDIGLWTLTCPVAKTLAGLSALRILSIRIEGFPSVRAVPRSYRNAQQAAQPAAWDMLTKDAVWAARLVALRIENANLGEEHLFALLRKSRYCRELWLSKCPQIGSETWNFLGCDWEGRAALRVLGLIRCGGQPDSDMLDLIGREMELQSMTLC